MGRIVETVWDCPYCGNKGIRGQMTDCPSCGRTRSKTTKFYLPDELTFLDKDISEVANPDWLCPFCDSYNPDSLSVCKNCGGSREDAKNYFDVLRENGESPDLKENQDGQTLTEAIHSKSRSVDEAECRKENQDGQMLAESIHSKSRSVDEAECRKVNKKLIFGLIGSVSLVSLFILLLAIFIPKTQNIVVNELLWNREIAIQENRLVQESGWSVPGDAVEIVNARQEVHHTDTVLDHYETVQEQKSRQVFDGYDIHYSYRDLGNGAAEQVEHKTPRYRTEYYYETVQKPVYKQVPVYETKYYYTVWRWVYDHTEKASGKITQDNSVAPYWPDFNLSEKQREGLRTQSYTVSAVRKNKTKKYKTSYEIWESLEAAHSYKVKVSGNKIIEVL